MYFSPANTPCTTAAFYRRYARIASTKYSLDLIADGARFIMMSDVRRMKMVM